MGANFPMLFFVASAVIIHATTARVVENQRALMRVLRTLSYGDRDTILHYEAYPLMIRLLGSVIGSLMEISIVGSVMTDLYNIYYNLPIGGAMIH